LNISSLFANTCRVAFGPGEHKLAPAECSDTFEIKFGIKIILHVETHASKAIFAFEHGLNVGMGIIYGLEDDVLFIYTIGKYQKVIGFLKMKKKKLILVFY
jgi:hypothetical protein